MRMIKNNEREMFRLYINNTNFSICLLGIVQIVLFAGFFWVWLTDTIDIWLRKFKK